jgi:short-subunit dehydrogenase
VDLDVGELMRTAEELDVEAVVADVRDPTHADRVVTRALERFGRLDAVVANAGLGHAGEFAAMTPERIDDLIATNVRAPVLLARAALPTMIEQGRGSVVFVSSVVGVLLVPRESLYSATKAAIEGFAEPLREELRDTGVTVTTVMPAVVATAFFDDRGEPYRRRLPRPVPPERIAAVIVRAVESGGTRLIVPRWFALPVRIRGTAPGLYRRLARRFG